MKSYNLLRLILIFMLCIAFSQLESQCAMCRQVVESGKKNGSTAAEGINMAIFYLLSVPFLAVGTVSIAFWRRWKASQK